MALPFAMSKDSAPAGLNGPGAAQALLVEGSAVARSILSRVLCTAVHRQIAVHGVTTPQEAPPLLQGFDIALIDIDLDDVAALELIARLPSSCWRVATTLYDEEERLLPALQMGVHGYLLKQDRYERQVEGLQRILRGGPDLSPALARSVLDGLRRAGDVAPEVDQILGALGRGLSPKETARALKCSVGDIHSTTARVYTLMRQPPATVLARIS